MKRILLLIAYCLLLIGMTSCHRDSRTRFRDLKDVEAEPTEIRRLDLGIQAMQADNVLGSLAALRQAQPGITELWLQSVDLLGAPDEATQQELHGFLTNPDIRQLFQDEQKQFKDITGVETEVGQAFARLKQLDPTTNTPLLFLFTSGFDTKAITAPGTKANPGGIIGLSVDYYLGPDYALYQHLSYRYERQLFAPCYMATDFLSAYLMQHYPYHMTQNRLLDHIIYYGSMKYLLSVLFPEREEWQIMGYTEDQWNWCIKNEKEAWGYLLDQKYLFSSDGFEIQKFIEDGPFTQPLTQDSPGRMGVWFGYRIVSAYMEAHPEVTMEQLLHQTNAQQILSQSQYSPN